MNAIGIHKVNKGTSYKVLGLASVKYILDPECKAMKDQGIYKFVEGFGIKHYCLVLPFIVQGVFEGKMALVYDDWDVGNINFNKGLSSLCAKLFEYNVFG
jgi:hypothetical protein